MRPSKLLRGLPHMGWLFSFLALSAAMTGTATFATGCGAVDLQPAVDATNETRLKGHKMAAVIIDECEKPYGLAAEMTEAGAAAEVARLDGMGCPSALLALTAYSTVHKAEVALLEAIMAGECVATIARDVPEKCSLLEMGRKIMRAEEALSRAYGALGVDR